MPMKIRTIHEDFWSYQIGGSAAEPLQPTFTYQPGLGSELLWEKMQHCKLVLLGES